MTSPTILSFLSHLFLFWRSSLHSLPHSPVPQSTQLRFAAMASPRSSLLLAVALCALAAVACAARDLRPRAGFVVRGRAFCDTCRAGFETPATTYVAGAKVRVQCSSRSTGAKTCSFDGVTDHTGTYSILVADEHEHELCESVLISSPDSTCAKLLAGREKAPVFLTSNNGVASNVRIANALGFQKDTALAECAQVLKMYEQDQV